MNPELGDRISALVGQRTIASRRAVGGYTAADWPPPWTASRVDRVLELIEAVARTTPPPGLPRLADQKDEVFSGWASVARDPGPFLSLGLCSAAWLVESIDQLLRSSAPWGGPAPDELSCADDAPLAVITAGHFAARAGLPPSSPGSRARISQLMQLKPSLPWVCRLLGIEPPDAPLGYV